MKSETQQAADRINKANEAYENAKAIHEVNKELFAAATMATNKATMEANESERAMNAARARLTDELELLQVMATSIQNKLTHD